MRNRALARDYVFRRIKKSSPRTIKSQFFDQCFDYQDGKRVGEVIFQQPIIPDAIFTNGDEVAAGIIAAAQVHGYRYPQDFEIIGEENTPLSEILGFPSVDYCMTSIGEQGVSLLLSGEIARTPIRPSIHFRD